MENTKQEKKTIEKPIVIGDFLAGGEMAWAWWDSYHSRLAVIGDNEVSAKRAFIKQMAQLIHKRDIKSVYWITAEEKEGISEVIQMEAIPWVERFPDPPKEYRDRDLFIENRKFFSSSFFTLLAGIKGVQRKDLLPPSSYQAHLEGPMGGYLRALEAMQEGELKKWVEEEVNSLESVPWYRTTGEGTKFYLSSSKNEYERALSFLVAAWSFWTETCAMEESQQMMLIIEPPKEFLLPSADPAIQGIIVEALRILNFLSITTTTTVVLSSETLYPAAEHNYRFKLFFETKESDIDLQRAANKKALNLSKLYEAWEQGRNDAGLWEDKFTGERLVAFFRTERMEFMDEFEFEN